MRVDTALSDATWVSSAGYVGPGKWDEALREAGKLELPPKRRRRRATPRPAPAPVAVTAVDREVLRVALSLAEGDASRLVLQPDGSVIVAHKSKRRKVEHP